MWCLGFVFGLFGSVHLELSGSSVYLSEKSTFTSSVNTPHELLFTETFIRIRFHALAVKVCMRYVYISFSFHQKQKRVLYNANAMHIRSFFSFGSTGFSLDWIGSAGSAWMWNVNGTWAETELKLRPESRNGDKDSSTAPHKSLLLLLLQL